MSDTRDQLIDYFLGFGGGDAMASMKMADAILERWDLTPKPVIEPRQLGMLVTDSYTGKDFAQQGERMLRALAGFGLTIVRIEEG